MFGKSQRGSVRSNVSSEKNSLRQEKAKVHAFQEEQFEAKCIQVIKTKQWETLELFAVGQLDKTNAKSAKGFFYLGIALYKMEIYDQAIKAFERSNEIKPKDP